MDVEFIESPEQELQRRQERLRRERKEARRASRSALPPLEWWPKVIPAWGNERGERQEAWAAEQEGNKGPPTAPAFGWERSELRSVLPGKHGLNCVFYQVLAYRTCHLREKVYITLEVEGEEFRPLGDTEHSPYEELFAYQKASIVALGREKSYGEGRELLEARFVCYSPSGSGAAEEAVRDIAGVLEELREFVELDALAQSLTSWKYASRYLIKTVRDASPGYRPPEGALPHRRDPPGRMKEAKLERRELDA